jgi:hypothetical protein
MVIETVDDGDSEVVTVEENSLKDSPGARVFVLPCGFLTRIDSNLNLLSISL